MHLAFVSPFDPNDVRVFSGIPHFMVRALRERVDRLSVVGPLPVGGAVRGRVDKLRHRLRGQPYLRAHTWAGVRPMAEAARRPLAELQPDAILSPSTLPLAALDADCPTASWADATFEANLLFYPGFTDLSEAHIVEAHDVERAAIRRASAAVFASAYAARSAAGYYGAAAESVHVVPFGANLDPEDIPSADAVGEAIAARSMGTCRLLFVGGDWSRKGGDIALRVAEELADRGRPTTLTVIGTTPPVTGHPNLRVEGFLRKSVPDERARLRQLFVESHFLCMPVRAEDFGIVFAEAAAFGVPSVSSRVGGVPSAVADGESGVLFDVREQPGAIADRLEALLSDIEGYRALAASARSHYELELNWGVAVERVLALLQPLT